MITSKLCVKADFEQPFYRYWVERIKETPLLHRKQWEYVMVCQALDERRMLQPGRRGVGFGVGNEPLPDLFASLGCSVLATDYGDARWAVGGRFPEDHRLNHRYLSDPNTFQENVELAAVDMNSIPDWIEGFDFSWSVCSMEHLGSIEQGKRFVLNQMRCLKPGGWSVHTTEFNMSSNDDTIETEDLVLFRRRDIDDLCARLEAAGHSVEPIDYSFGSQPEDRHVDLPPYSRNWHLRLDIYGHVVTSILLLIRKGGAS